MVVMSMDVKVKGNCLKVCIFNRLVVIDFGVMSGWTT